MPPSDFRYDLPADSPRSAMEQIAGSKNDACNGYVWHTTASGKTLTASTPSNQPGDCPAPSAMKTPNVKPPILPKQRGPLGYPCRTLATLSGTLRTKLLSGELGVASVQEEAVL